MRQGSGPKRHVVQIQALTEAADSFGQPVPSWTTVATVRGLMEPLSGKELVNAREVKADVTNTLTTRYRRVTVGGTRVEITANMRAVFEGGVYNFAGVVDTISRHRELIITCTKVVVPTP